MGRSDALGNHAKPGRVRHVLFELSRSFAPRAPFGNPIGAYGAPRVTERRNQHPAQIFGGEARTTARLAAEKPRGAKADMLGGVAVSREEARRRRHPRRRSPSLPEEQVTVNHGGKSSPSSCSTCSGGGAMVTAPSRPNYGTGWICIWATTAPSNARSSGSGTTASGWSSPTRRGSNVRPTSRRRVLATSFPAASPISRSKVRWNRTQPSIGRIKTRRAASGAIRSSGRDRSTTTMRAPRCACATSRAPAP